MAYTIQNQTDGQIVINTFLSKFQKYNGYSITQDELLKQVVNYEPKKFLNILGLQFDLTLDRDITLMTDSMDNLALQTKGGLPTTQGFLDALKENYDQYKYIKKAFSESATEVATIASDFGQGSLTVIKTVSKFLPFLVFGGVALFVYINREKFKV